VRWTKEHWARLEQEERSILMETIKGLKGTPYRDAFLPDDVSCCRGCGEPLQLCGCYEILEMLTAKMGVPCPDI